MKYYEEQLSEFTYGYGVLREIEMRLNDMGIKTTPYLPNLRQEGKHGADVALDCLGVPLLLQFKLGERLGKRNQRKYNRMLNSHCLHELPFWRYEIDTAKKHGQFRSLLFAEMKGAVVRYLAPRFSCWRSYDYLYRCNYILRYSMCTSPKQIRQAMTRWKLRMGKHAIIYDPRSAYICSEPVSLQEYDPTDIGNTVSKCIEDCRQQDGRQKVGQITNEMFRDFYNEHDWMFDDPDGPDTSDEVASENGGARPTSLELKRRQHKRFIELIENRHDNKDEIFAHELGLAFYRLGTLLVLATVDK